MLLLEPGQSSLPALELLAPVLLLFWYSAWAALQPSELHATE